MKRGQDMTGLRDQNLSVILSAIWENAPVSRKKLADLSGLAPSSITRLIRQLKQYKLIIENINADSPGGYKPLLISPNPDAGLIISLDLSGSRIRGGIFDAANQLLYVRNKPFERSGLASIEKQIIDFTHELQSHPDARDKNFLGLGVSFPGVIRADKGIAASLRLELYDCPLQKILTKEFNLPVYLEVDSAAAALAEKYYGAGRGIDNYIYVLVSSGIGGSIIIDGKLVRGGAGFGGMGHFIVEKNGPICLCGKRGCLEMVAASPAILEDIRHLLKYGLGDPLITKMVGEDFDQLTICTVSDAAYNGSPLAKEVIKNSAHHLAFAISTISMILDINKFIIGGEVPQCTGDLYYDYIRQSMEDVKSYDFGTGNVEIIPAQLESDSFLRGISMLTLQEVLGIKY